MYKHFFKRFFDILGICEEVRKEMRQEYQGIIDDKAAEIAVLKALQSHDNDGG